MNKKEVLKVAKRVVPRTTLKKLHSIIDDEHFEAIAKYALVNPLERECEYYQKQCDRFFLKQKDIFFLHTKLLQTPHAIRAFSHTLSHEDLNKVLRLFESMEKEVRLLQKS